MQHQRKNDLLNSDQLRSVTIVLRMFEEDLRQMDTWLDERQADGILYSRQLHLTPRQRAEARNHIAAALGEITVLAEKLGLEPEVEDAAGLIRGQMSVAWANLIDSQTKKLKRYGKVHPEVAKEIDPYMQRLAHIALELSSLFEKHSSTPASPDAENLTEI
jgi:hypothetical protein